MIKYSTYKYKFYSKHCCINNLIDKICRQIKDTLPLTMNKIKLNLHSKLKKIHVVICFTSNFSHSNKNIYVHTRL